MQNLSELYQQSDSFFATFDYKISIYHFLVGITLGVIVLFIVGAVLLLVFAKSTERWCFANDDYRYMDPQDKRQVPSQAQVFRFL